MSQRKRPLKYPKYLKTLGKKIRALRLKREISQEALANEAGIERSYMGAIERGERNPSFDKIVSIANALKVPAKELIG